jgi:hypothetical protein
MSLFLPLTLLFLDTFQTPEQDDFTFRFHFGGEEVPDYAEPDPCKQRIGSENSFSEKKAYVSFLFLLKWHLF